MLKTWTALVILAFIAIMAVTAGTVRTCHRETVSVASAVLLAGCHR